MSEQESLLNRVGDEEVAPDSLPGLGLAEIGRRLRDRRNELGLTLADVQAATKIRGKYLKAIETGDESAIPGVVYARGFVRSYADRLGLDGTELMRQYRLRTEHELGTSHKDWGQIDVAPPGVPSGQPQRPARTGTAPEPRGNRLAIWAGVLAVLLVLVYGAGQWMLASQVPPGDDTALNGIVDPGDEPGENGVDDDPAAGDEPEEPEEPAEPEIERVQEGGVITYLVTGQGSLDLSLRAQGAAVWVGEIFLDGESQPNPPTLQSGDRLDFTVEDEFRAHVGNARNLFVEINGVDLGILDETGPWRMVVRWAEQIDPEEP